MGESTTKLVFEGEVGKAVLGIVKVIEKMKEAKGEVKDFGKVSKETDVLGDSITKAAGSVKNFITGFATIGGIIGAIKSLVSQMKEIASLRNEFFNTALSVEELGIKIANLRNDVTKAGLDKVTTDIEKIADAGRIKLKPAAAILTRATEVFGDTPKTMTAATSVSKLMGPAGLTAEEANPLFKMFEILGADTEEKQNKMMNEIIASRNGSTANLGKYISNYSSVLETDIRKKIPFKQSLAKFSSAMAVSANEEEAAARDQALTELITNPKAGPYKFLVNQAKKDGSDFTKMNYWERYAYVQQEYKEFEANNQLDKFRLKVFPKGSGFENAEAMFSEKGTQAFSNATKILDAAIEDYVNKRVSEFSQTLTSKAAKLENVKMIDQSKLTNKFWGNVVLQQKVMEAWKNEHAATASAEEVAKMWLNVKEVEQYKIGRDLMRQNLVLAYEQAGPAQRKKIENLYNQFNGMTSATINNDLINEINNATGNLELQRNVGRSVNPKLFTEYQFDPIMAGDPTIGGQGGGRLVNRPISDIAADDLKTNTKQAADNTKTTNDKLDQVINKLDDVVTAIRDANSSGGISPPVYPGEH